MLQAAIAVVAFVLVAVFGRKFVGGPRETWFWDLNKRGIPDCYLRRPEEAFTRWGRDRALDAWEEITEPVHRRRRDYPARDWEWRRIAVRERDRGRCVVCGRGTARIAFKHPELFCSAAPMGGGHQWEKQVSVNKGVEGDPAGYVFDPSNNTWELARKIDVKMLGVVGTKDFNYQANLAGMDHRKAKGVAYQKIIVPDVPHSAAQVYDKIGAAAMKFHAACFRIE